MNKVVLRELNHIIDVSSSSYKALLLSDIRFRLFRADWPRGYYAYPKVICVECKPFGPSLKRLHLLSPKIACLVWNPKVC